MKIRLVMGLLLMICLLFFSGFASSLAVDVVPVPDSHTSITDTDCGKETPVEFTITNNGGGGVLCWYWTSQNTQRRKLTSHCVDPHSVDSSDADIKMPTSGQKAVTLQLECYDFYSLFGGDECVDSYSYSQALQNEYSGGAEEAFGIRHFDLSCSKLSIDATASESSISLYNNEEREVSIHVSNNGDNTIQCSYEGESKGQILPSGSTSFYVTVKAPSTSQGTTSRSISVRCSDSVTGQETSDVATISISYQPNPCDAAAESATNTYNTATNKIKEANSAIQKADSRCSGTDTTTATGHKNQADSYLSSSQTSLSSARTSCSAGDTNNAMTQANDAENNADRAVNSATQAINAVEQAVQDCISGRKEASDLIQQTDQKIRSADSWIEKAESVIRNGTNLGMDTHQEQADVETAKSSLDNAKTKKQEASSYFDSKKYDLSKSSANAAVDDAEDAEASAKKAYNSLYKVVKDCQTAQSEMSTTTSEISIADQTFAKLAVVLRNVKKNTDVSSVEYQVNEERAKIDSARDYLSQAQNKFSAGYCTEAVNKATSARDTAASANNRLSGVVESMTLKVTESLDKAQLEAYSKIGEAESKIAEASDTYAASGDEIVAARNSAQDAQIALNEANAKISKAKSTTDLTEFLTESSEAFTKLEEVDQKVEEAKGHGQNAINWGYATIGAGAVAVLATGGAGFMYYRKKKKGKGKRSEEKGVSVEKTTKKKATKKTCKKCGDEHPLDYNNCPKCGKKLVGE